MLLAVALSISLETVLALRAAGLRRPDHSIGQRVRRLRMEDSPWSSAISYLVWVGEGSGHFSTDREPPVFLGEAAKLRVGRRGFSIASRPILWQLGQFREVRLEPCQPGHEQP